MYPTLLWNICFTIITPRTQQDNESDFSIYYIIVLDLVVLNTKVPRLLF